MKKTTSDDDLIVYAELSDAGKRAVQRRLQDGSLSRIVTGLASALPPSEWPAQVARHRMQVCAGLFPNAVIGFRSAFDGGQPAHGTFFLTYSYDRKVQLPGMEVVLVKGAPHGELDQPIAGLPLHFPSLPRLLLENLTISRGSVPKAAGRDAVEQRLAGIAAGRGENELNRIRDQARGLSYELDYRREFFILDAIIGGLLSTRHTAMATPQGRARTAC